jgi:hypothetical protein
VRADAITALGPVIEECGIDYHDEELDLGPDLAPSVSEEMFATIIDEIQRLYSDDGQPQSIRRSSPWG